MGEWGRRGQKGFTFSRMGVGTPDPQAAPYSQPTRATPHAVPTGAPTPSRLGLRPSPVAVQGTTAVALWETDNRGLFLKCYEKKTVSSYFKCTQSAKTCLVSGSLVSTGGRRRMGGDTAQVSFVQILSHKHTMIMEKNN